MNTQSLPSAIKLGYIFFALAANAEIFYLPPINHTYSKAVKGNFPVPQSIVNSPNPDNSTDGFAAAAAYGLVDNFDAGNWFNSFTVEALGTGDPTHGYVNYVSQSAAQSQGLYRIQNNQVYIGVDSSTVLNPNGVGRNSVRIHSNKAYNRGLIIADFAHAPSSTCGSWPAFWMVGPNWPSSGEIDIFEGVNVQPTNQMTLHTSPGCRVSVGPEGQTGTNGPNPNCGDGGGFNGCSVTSNVGTSYGTPFNIQNGGVFATEWTSSGIKIWNFQRNQIPGDIQNGNPNPAGWGTPAANFAGCNFDAYFRNLQIIFDITFCGDWAGGVWSSGGCASAASSCQNYVAQNPGAFRDTYWLINYVKVFSG